MCMFMNPLIKILKLIKRYKFSELRIWLTYIVRFLKYIHSFDKARNFFFKFMSKEKKK